MLLKLKNASTLALTNLIIKATAGGGVVKHIELSPQEAFSVLHEINDNKEIRKHYSYVEDDTTCGLGFRLSGKANEDEFTKIANEWHKKTLGIIFDDCPLYIVVPPPAKEEPSAEGSVQATKPLTQK